MKNKTPGTFLQNSQNKNFVNAKNESDKAVSKGSRKAFQSVCDALMAIELGEWQLLAQFAQSELNSLRSNRNMSRYLAGCVGEDIVNTSVLALELGALTTKGRKAKRRHLQNKKCFLTYFRGIICSVINNFSRHPQAMLRYERIGLARFRDGFVDPPDPNDFTKQLEMRDLLSCLLPGVRKELRHNPKQLAILNAYVRGLGHDTMLPTCGHGKFEAHSVRKALRKHLQKLASTDLHLENPTGRELLM